MVLYTRKEIESRNRADNAAIIIDNVVYDVSAFCDEHPGGTEILLNTAGKDASQCFHDIGHSDYAIEWRSSFKIGEIVEEEKWEVITRPQYQFEEKKEAWDLSSVLNVCLEPIIFAAAAVFLYWCFLM